MKRGLIRKFYWVGTRDMLADGLTKGGIDRFLLHRVSDDCVYETRQLAISHTKVGSATIPPGHQGTLSEQIPPEEVGIEHSNSREGLGDPDQP